MSEVPLHQHCHRVCTTQRPCLGALFRPNNGPHLYFLPLEPLPPEAGPSRTRSAQHHLFPCTLKRVHAAEQVPVYVYGDSYKNLKDLQGLLEHKFHML